MTSGMIEHQRARREAVVAKVDEAIAVIAAEIEKGTYQGAKITVAEVCRRAGIGLSTLKNATHETTRARLRKWLEKANKSQTLRNSSERKASDRKDASLSRKLEILSRELDLFKLQFEDICRRNDDLEQSNRDLRAENARLRADALRVANLNDGK